MAIQPQPQQDKSVKSFWEILSQQEEKTRIYIMQMLLDPKNIEFITEYPDFGYTKAMTRFATWTRSIQQVTDLDDVEITEVVDTMCLEFMKKNVSHKRRRSHEIVNALKGEDANANVLDHEHRGLRRFLGIR